MFIEETSLIIATRERLNSLKRFKEEASEVKEGNECGMVLDNFQDIKQNDILESYLIEEQKRSL